jgi:hypothetical protein
MAKRTKPIKLKTKILITVNWTWVRALITGGSVCRPNLN